MVTVNDALILVHGVAPIEYYIGPDVSATFNESLYSVSTETAPWDIPKPVLDQVTIDVSSAVNIVYGSDVISIDSGDTITSNSGLIFKENAQTSGLTDKEIANSLGIAFTVVRSIRKGVPDWRFYNSIKQFGGTFSIDPNLVYANYNAQIKGLINSKPASPFNQNKISSASMYFGLGDPPRNTSILLGDPYQSEWKFVSEFDFVPEVETALNVSSIDDQGAYLTHLWFTGGRVLATLDERVPSQSSYDLSFGTDPGGATSGSGGSMTIDEFDPVGGSGISLADEERLASFGFTRPSSGVVDTSVHYVKLRQHPSCIRVLGLDSTSQMMVSFEKIGDSWNG